VVQFQLAGASALSVLGFSAALAGNYTMAPILASVISTGFIALLFIMNTRQFSIHSTHV